jgi:conjugal transfer/entry exclusion protein
MHASVEQLLNLRDAGTEAGEVATHVAGCERCQGELGRLRAIQVGLQSLPEFAVPQGSWSRIAQARVITEKKASVQLTGWFWAGSLAAALAVAVVLFGLLSQVPREMATPGTANLAGSQPTLASQVHSAQSASSDREQNLESLMARSRQLDWALQAMPEGPQLVSADTAGTISLLEDRVAMIDYRLSMTDEKDLSPAQEMKLWKERVDLMDSLVQVRYTQAQYASF